MIVAARSIHELAARVLLGRSVDDGPSGLLEDELGRAKAVYERILDGAAAALTKHPPAEWAHALVEVLRRVDLHDLALSLTGLRTRAAMLGADDSRIEVETERVDAPDPFRRDLETLRLDKPATPRPNRSIGTHLDPVRPWAEVVDEFRSRKAVTRSVWDQMTAEQRHEAFTVARQSSAELVGKVQDVVARSLAAGESAARARLRVQEVGRNLTAAHAETVYRNAVQTAYARGRAAHMTQPHVVALRPWWQVMVVDDARTRPTHLAVNHWAMRADDSGWQATYPPFGFNCRCRVVARSEKWRQSAAPRVHSGPLPDLPDDGWHTKPPPQVSFDVKPPAVPPPEPVARPDRPAAGPSLLRPSDDQLDVPTRRALEKLDSVDKNRLGRVRPADLGLRLPTPDERAAARAPFEERNVDPEQWARLVPPNFDSVPAEHVIVDRKRVGGDVVADAIRRGVSDARATAVRVGDRYHVIDGHEHAIADAVNDLAGGRGKVRLRIVDAPPPLARPFNSHAKAREALEQALTQPPARGELRRTTQRVLRNFGMRSRDNWRGLPSADLVRIDTSALHQLGAIASHNNVTGRITHSRATLDRAWAGLKAAAHGHEATAQQVDALSTIFHEEIHGAGPDMRRAYHGPGQWLEEAITEIGARKATRATLGSAIADERAKRVVALPVQPFWEWQGGADPPGATHSYDVPISRLLGVARKHGVSDQQIEAASVALKGAGVDTEVRDPRAYIELFAGKVREAGGRPGQSFVEELLSVLKGGIRPMKKPMGLTRQELLLGRDAPTSIAELERNDVVGALAYFNHELGQGLEIRPAYVTARALAMLQDDGDALYEVLLERIAEHYKLAAEAPTAPTP